VSPVAGRAFLYSLQRLPQHRRRGAIWAMVGGAVVTAIMSELLLYAPAKAGVFILLLGLLPGMLAYVVWRTALASAVVSLVPLYFGIGAWTLGRPLHMPEIPLDRAVPLQPAWMLVYGSLYVFVFLPLLTVKQEQLFRSALKGYLTVLIAALCGLRGVSNRGATPDCGEWREFLRLVPAASVFHRLAVQLLSFAACRALVRVGAEILPRTQRCGACCGAVGVAHWSIYAIHQAALRGRRNWRSAHRVYCLCLVSAEVSP
jgi:hypothetical protein